MGQLCRLVNSSLNMENRGHHISNGKRGIGGTSGHRAEKAATPVRPQVLASITRSPASYRHGRFVCHNAFRHFACGESGTGFLKLASNATDVLAVGEGFVQFFHSLKDRIVKHGLVSCSGPNHRVDSRRNRSFLRGGAKQIPITALVQYVNVNRGWDFYEDRHRFSRTLSRVCVCVGARRRGSDRLSD